MWGEGENNREWRKGWKEDDALGYSGRSRECSQVVEKEENFHGNWESGGKRENEREWVEELGLWLMKCFLFDKDRKE